MKFLYAAYVAAWVVHIVYLTVLTRGYKRLREEVEEVEKR